MKKIRFVSAPEPSEYEDVALDSVVPLEKALLDRDKGAIPNRWSIQGRSGFSETALFLGTVRDPFVPVLAIDDGGAYVLYFVKKDG